MKKNKIFTTNGVSFAMIAVQGGTYTMGALDNDPDAYVWEKPAHTETIADFMIGETQVTQELWNAVMGSNPSYFKGDLQRPVECVSWNDCQEFIKKLNELTKQNFRLPTEEEWEYAARGGNKSKGYKYSGSNDVDKAAWYRGNSRGKTHLYCSFISWISTWFRGGSSGETHPVKTKIPNELGVYDMNGNVYEWCDNYWTKDYKSTPHESGNRVCRGGYYDSERRRVRVADRISCAPDFCACDHGLRLAL